MHVLTPGGGHSKPGWPLGRCNPLGFLFWRATKVCQPQTMDLIDFCRLTTKLVCQVMKTWWACGARDRHPLRAVLCMQNLRALLSPACQHKASDGLCIFNAHRVKITRRRSGNAGSGRIIDSLRFWSRIWCALASENEDYWCTVSEN